jgi:hypothetical protein
MAMKVASRLGWVALQAALAAAIIAEGCGTPGTPLPPTLNLPDPVTDLTAVRTGNQVALAWTMPKKNTDKLLLKGSYGVRVCRKDAAEDCAVAPRNLMLASGASGEFTDTLPAVEAAGAPRALTYFVEVNNAHGRSAGASNVAQVLAGEAPAAVAGLSAEVRKGGVVLRWTADAQQRSTTVVRLRRKLVTPSQNAKPKERAGRLAPPPEPLEQTLLVESRGQDGQAFDRAIDKDIHFGEGYEYRAQRVARVMVDGKTLELAGPLSDPVRVEAINVFPPAIPTGLAAVASTADATNGPSIDLSWQPVTDADLAGYVVYRREAGGGWQRVSPAQPVVGPAFHDSDVQAGHTYSYAVSAIDQGGHESGRSAETEETVRNP